MGELSQVPQPSFWISSCKSVNSPKSGSWTWLWWIHRLSWTNPKRRLRNLAEFTHTISFLSVCSSLGIFSTVPQYHGTRVHPAQVPQLTWTNPKSRLVSPTKFTCAKSFLWLSVLALQFSQNSSVPQYHNTRHFQGLINSHICNSYIIYDIYDIRVQEFCCWFAFGQY